MRRLWVHASEVLTGEGIRKKDGRHVTEEDLGRIPDGAVVFNTRKVKGIEVPGEIEWVGPTSELPKKYARLPKTDLKGRRAVIPGLVDCHTHLVFAGDRSDEFAARCGGATYAEIAARGGGIMATVRATRAASHAELERLAIARVKEAMSFGVRTLEIKSGYGLSSEAEIKLLEVAQRLKARFPQINIVTTFLGAHAFPPEKDRWTYVSELTEKMLPEIARRKLADYCDVFTDEGYFSVDESRELLEAAKRLGFKLKVHADEMEDTGAAALAVEVGAHSADHLLRINPDNIQKMAGSQTVAVLLPGTAFYLRAAQAPARKLIEAGAAVALSTDFNPGTCMTLSLPVVMTTAALYLGMTRAQIFAGVTYNAAKAIGLEKRIGTISPGLQASLTAIPFRRFEEMYYRFAWSPSATGAR